MLFVVSLAPDVWQRYMGFAAADMLLSAANTIDGVANAAAIAAVITSFFIALLRLGEGLGLASSP
jgi:hypothetical protein